MSKSALVIGLIISVAVHFVLIWPLARQSPNKTEEPLARSVRVVELPVVAAVPEQLEALPQEQPEPEIEPEPQLVNEPINEVIEQTAKRTVNPVQEPPVELPRPASQPLEPFVSAPPSPMTAPLEPVAEGLRTAFDGPGDFAGNTDVPLVPALWIDWGSPQEAINVLSAGGMQLVVLESDESIRQSVNLTAQGPALTAWRPGRQSTFSTRLRIVDHVQAFSSIVKSISLGPEKHLAVLFPMRVDQLVDMAERRAAFDEGADMDQIRGFAGKFMISSKVGASQSSNGVSFIITHLQRR